MKIYRKKKNWKIIKKNQNVKINISNWKNKKINFKIIKQKYNNFYLLKN